MQAEILIVRQDLMGRLQEILSEHRGDLENEINQLKEVVNFETREKIHNFINSISDNPNAQEFYRSLQIGLGAIHTSALSIKGGGAKVSEGSLAMIASALDMSENLVEMIPIVGPIASKFFGLTSAVITQMDTVRQTNIFENIAAMMTAKEARKIFESVARELTLAYSSQIRRLATRELAQQSTVGSEKLLQQAQSKLVCRRVKSPAEQVTYFAILWMMDEVLMNVHKLDQEMKEKGIEKLLITAVTQHKPSEDLLSFWSDLGSKLNFPAIPVCNESGAVMPETWNPMHFWTMPGVKVEIDQGAALYFAGNGTNSTTYGFRLGTREDASTLGLLPTTGPVQIPPNPSSAYAPVQSASGFDLSPYAHEERPSSCCVML